MIDLILSFAVYLVPLMTPEALFPAGMYLFFSASRLAESPGWVVLDWSAMLAVQAMLFGLLRAARRLRAMGRALLRLGAFAVMVPAVNVLLLWVIPVSYLVEESTAPEVNRLTEVCHVDGIYLPPRIGGLHVDATAAVLPVRRQPDYRLALLHVDGCRVEDLGISPDAEPGGVSPSGAWLWRPPGSSRKGDGPWVLRTPSGVTLKQPIGIAGSSSPQIFDDGSGVFWLETEPSPRIVVVTADGIRHIEGAGVPKWTDRVLEGFGPAGPFYYQGGNTFDVWLTLDGNGEVSRSIALPEGLSRFGHHLRPLKTGWIAWDTYREADRYIVSWNVDGRTGTRTLSKGLRIDTIAFDERGEHVAISASASSSRISSQRAESWLLRTSDGAELFRRYAPTTSRPVVALPAGRYFAVDESHDRRSSVRVYDLKTKPS